MGTIQDLSQLNLHTMQVDTLAIDFGGVMSDFIDRDTLGLLANIAQVPLEIFEIPYWEKNEISSIQVNMMRFPTFIRC